MGFIWGPNLISRQWGRRVGRYSEGWQPFPARSLTRCRGRLTQRDAASETAAPCWIQDGADRYRGNSFARRSCSRLGAIHPGTGSLADPSPPNSLSTDQINHLRMKI